MEFNTVELPEFKMIGVTMRTNTATQMQKPTIPDFFYEFINNKKMEKIPHVENPKLLYGAYVDYESDADGDYTILLGAKVSEFADVAGMEQKTIPASKYAVFDVENTDKIPVTWFKIWMADLERTYTGDFELHNQETGEIKIHVAIK